MGERANGHHIEQEVEREEEKGGREGRAHYSVIQTGRRVNWTVG